MERRFRIVVDDGGPWAHRAYCVRARDVQRLADGAVRALFVDSDGHRSIVLLPGRAWAVEPLL